MKGWALQRHANGLRQVRPKPERTATTNATRGGKVATTNHDAHALIMTAKRAGHVLDANDFGLLSITGVHVTSRERA